MCTNLGDKSPEVKAEINFRSPRKHQTISGIRDLTLKLFGVLATCCAKAKFVRTTCRVVAQRAKPEDCSLQSKDV